MNTTPQSMPGPSIGERFNPLAGEQLENPYPFYQQARRDEPVFFSPALRMWVVTDYQSARTVLSDPSLFSSRDSINSIAEICPDALAVLSTGSPPTPQVVNSDPPEHARWRKVINRGFAGPRMRRLEPEIREIARARINAMAPLGHADLLADLALPIPLQVIARLCDIGDDHLADLTRWGQSLIALESSMMDPDLQIRVAKDVVEYQLFMRRHIERKRASLGDDITSEMISGGDNDPFSDDELVNQMVGLVLAGHETTAHLIGNALYHLLSEPARWRELVADPTMIPAALEETLRIDPPLPTFIRTATADVEVAGKKIAKGETVLVVFGSANHDAGHFADGEVFDQHRRAESAHMGFGYGIHFCAGAPLARLEARVVLEELALNLSNLRLAPQQQLCHIPTLILHGFERLDIEWD